VTRYLSSEIFSVGQFRRIVVAGAISMRPMWLFLQMFVLGGGLRKAQVLVAPFFRLFRHHVLRYLPLFSTHYKGAHGVYFLCTSREEGSSVQGIFLPFIEPMWKTLKLRMRLFTPDLKRYKEGTKKEILCAQIPLVAQDNIFFSRAFAAPSLYHHLPKLKILEKNLPH